MTERIEIARQRLLRARETLLEADILIDEAFWRGALNRVYYAAFYATRAVLAARNLESSKHSGTIALFQQHFVKTGAIPVDAGRVLQRVFDARQSSDYAEVSEPTRTEVGDLRPDVGTFVSACER